MNMYKKCIHSFFEMIGFLTVIFVIATLIVPYSARMKIFYFFACTVTPSYFFSYFTFQLRLFSSRIWIRRFVAISFQAFVILAVAYLFGYLRFEINSLISYGICILLFIASTVFAYYVSDKIEQRNLNLINQKLACNNSKNIE